MTVKELIKKLEGWDGDRHVFIEVGANGATVFYPSEVFINEEGEIGIT